MARRSGNRLRHHLSPPVEYAGGQIAAFPNRLAERRMNDHLRLLLDRGDQAVPD